jgi:hypothetical protein
LTISIKTSIIAVLADNELDDEGDELDLGLAHHCLRTLVVVVPLLHQVVHLVELVADLLLQIGPQGLDLAADAVLVAHSRHSFQVKVLGHHSILLPH